MKIPNLEDSLKKRRYAMPQIEDFDAFVKDLDDEGIPVVLIAINPRELTPTQSEFNMEKVAKMAEKGWNKKPIITSDDDYILDGHHRWLAAVKLKKSIECQVVGMPIEDLIDFVKDKDYINSKKLSENLIEYYRSF